MQNQYKTNRINTPCLFFDMNNVNLNYRRPEDLQEEKNMKHKSIAATILALGIMISNAGIVSAHNDNFIAKKYSGI